MARTIQGDHKRFFQTYLEPYKGYYLTGDGAYGMRKATTGSPVA